MTSAAGPTAEDAREAARKLVELATAHADQLMELARVEADRIVDEARMKASTIQSSGHHALTASNLRDLWSRAVSELSPSSRLWAVEAVPLSFHDGMFIVAVRDELIRTQLESRLRRALEQALSKELGPSIQLIATIESAA